MPAKKSAGVRAFGVAIRAARQERGYAGGVRGACRARPQLLRCGRARRVQHHDRHAHDDRGRSRDTREHAASPGRTLNAHESPRRRVGRDAHGSNGRDLELSRRAGACRGCCRGARQVSRQAMGGLRTLLLALECGSACPSRVGAGRVWSLTTPSPLLCDVVVNDLTWVGGAGRAEWSVVVGRVLVMVF
jgi:hypothetical protein